MLIIFLLMSPNIVYLHGNSTVADVVQGLHCVNDHLSTISCSLRIGNNTSNITYWLLLTKLIVTEWEQDHKYVCMLPNTSRDYFCSFDVSHNEPGDYYSEEWIVDTDVFKISLCHHGDDGNESCSLLDGMHELAKNIKPKAPCCLTVLHNSSQYHFSWNSSYKKYMPFYSLFDHLMYQLYYYKRGDEDKDEGRFNNIKGIPVNTDSMNFSVDDHHFVPDSEYAVRVRSSPNQAIYKGEWSDWSPEVRWRTDSVIKDLSTNTFVPGLIILLCVMVPVFLFLCCGSLKKWRQPAFIPTPAPYFQTLYSDYQGDFKSWVVTPENRADMLKAEKTLQIDTLTECAEVQEENQAMSPYSNVSDLSSDASLLGLPCAMATTADASAPGLLKSQTQSSKPGSPAGDSGCWVGSESSFEKDGPWYSEYCTLNAFQKSHTTAAEHHGSSFNQIKANRDYQNECHHPSVI
ncbi:hypothetical protein LDENG_00147500 [Lucifuga dentata]|nr:hypothetical protein LDENG_00147500 [Lucifuga dentata]